MIKSFVPRGDPDAYEAKIQFDEAQADPAALQINHYSRPDGPLHDALQDCRASIAIARYTAGFGQKAAV